MEVGRNGGGGRANRLVATRRVRRRDGRTREGNGGDARIIEDEFPSVRGVASGVGC